MQLGEIPADSFFLSEVAAPGFQAGMGKYWAATRSFIEQAIRTGQLPAYTEERCANIKPVDKRTLITSLTANALQTTAGLATAGGLITSSGAAAGAAAASGSGAAAGGGGASAAGSAGFLAAAAPFLILGAVAFGVISAIFAHHAKAVAAEQTTMCAAVPGANEALAWVDSEFRSGRLSKQDASASLDELFRNFDRFIQPVLKDTGDGKKCNLACGYRRALQAIVAKKKAEYAEAPTSMIGVLGGNMDLQSALPWAAAAALAWAVLT